MKNVIHVVHVVRYAAVPALLSLGFLATPVWAQTPAAATTSNASSTAGMAKAPSRHAQKHEAFIEKRLSELHAELKITAQQSSQWDAFAQTMRDSAQQTEQAYRDRAQKLASMNADDAMKSYADLAQMHADNTRKLSTAFSTLYAALSDQQKKTADVLFRNHREQRHAARKHKRAAPSHSASAAQPASN